MKSDYKIIFLGDSGVGKTTMIASLINESFQGSVSKFVPEVIIPNNEFTARLVDLDISDQFTRDLEIKKADAIALVYSLDRFDSFMSIRSKWLPLIKQLNSNKIPVIIIGNKLDLVDEGSVEKNAEMKKETISYLTSVYDGGISVSSDVSSHDIDSISGALDTVFTQLIYPITPLFDFKSNEITAKCHSALERIFKILDCNRDGRLDEKEFKDIFVASKGTLDIFSIDFKELVENIPSFIPDGRGVSENGLTEYGFIVMISLIVRNNPNKVWSLLRFFRYEDDLTLDPDYLVPRFTVPNGHTVSVSPLGLAYLTSLFQLYDRDSRGYLTNEEISAMFETLSPSIPPLLSQFEKRFNTTASNQLTLIGFLSFWNLQTYTSYQSTLSYLGYLGCQSSTEMITINRNRVLDQKYKNFSRNIIKCLVLGSTGTKEFLNSFIGRKSDSFASSNNNNEASLVCNQIFNKYLILKEIENSNQLLTKKDSLFIQEIKESDIICLLFDQNDEDSFKYIESLYKNLNQFGVPILFIKQSNSTPSVNGNGVDSAIQTFFKRIGKQAKEFSTASANTIYHDIVKECENSVNLPLVDVSSSSSSSSDSSNLIKIAALVGSVSIVAAVVYSKWFK